MYMTGKPNGVGVEEKIKEIVNDIFGDKLGHQNAIDKLLELVSQAVAQAKKEERKKYLGIGLTIATGKLYCDMADFHDEAERILERPILTHEFANVDLWDELKVKTLASLIVQDTPQDSSEYDCPSCDSPGLMHVCPNKPMVCCSDCQQEKNNNGKK